MNNFNSFSVEDLFKFKRVFESFKTRFDVVDSVIKDLVRAKDILKTLPEGKVKGEIKAFCLAVIKDVLPEGTEIEPLGFENRFSSDPAAAVDQLQLEYIDTQTKSRKTDLALLDKMYVPNRGWEPMLDYLRTRDRLCEEIRQLAAWKREQKAKMQKKKEVK